MAQHSEPLLGRLTIKTRNLDASDLEGQAVLLSVRDEGKGMGSEELSRACEPFFTTKSEGQGSGLGLSVAHGFVYQSGGPLRLESTLGVGTTVQVRLPLLQSEEVEVVATPKVAASLASTGLRVLLVEDNSAVRSVLGGMLGKLGHESVESASEKRRWRFWRPGSALTS